MFQRTRNPLSEPTGAHGLTGMATLLLALSLLTQAVGAPAQDWLRYERDAVMAGQVWRVLTAHVVHMSWPHLLLNGVALALLAALLGKQQRAPDWWLASFVSAIAVALGLLVCQPALDWYVGLSGVVHGLFAAGCVALLRRHPAAATLALLALAGKLAWEQTHPAAPAREALLGGTIVVAAHLYGAVGGLLSAIAIHGRPIWRKLRRLSCRQQRMV